MRNRTTRKTALAAGLITIFCAATIEAGPNEDRVAALRKARMKIWTGAGMAAAGALVLPLTNARNGATEPAQTIGLTLIGGGMVTVWFGATQRRKALSPQTLVGVTLRDRRSVNVSVRW